MLLKKKVYYITDRFWFDSYSNHG